MKLCSLLFSFAKVTKILHIKKFFVLKEVNKKFFNYC
nr:MAG TPA: hypothetical protein [Caudoviricetes sp.]